MLGEYDFSEKVDFQAFNLDEIFKDGAEIWIQLIYTRSILLRETRGAFCTNF